MRTEFKLCIRNSKKMMEFSSKIDHSKAFFAYFLAIEFQYNLQIIDMPGLVYDMEVTMREVVFGDENPYVVATKQ